MQDLVFAYWDVVTLILIFAIVITDNITILNTIYLVKCYSDLFSISSDTHMLLCSIVYGHLLGFEGVCSFVFDQFRPLSAALVVFVALFRSRYTGFFRVECTTRSASAHRDWIDESATR